MSIKSISIEKTTKAVRVNENTVMIDLEAVPLDEENNFEPGVELQLYINNQLVDSFDSGIDGKIRTKLSYRHFKNDSELISFRLKDIKSGIESKIKLILIEDRNGNKILWGKKLYDLNKNLLQDFQKINSYLKNLTNSGIEENYELINQEFLKLEKLGELKVKLKELDQLEFKEKYIKEIEEIKRYCNNEMTIQEIGAGLEKLFRIKHIHDMNMNKFRQEILDEKNKQDKILSYQKRYNQNKLLLKDFPIIDQYFQSIIKAENYQSNSQSNFSNSKTFDDKLVINIYDLTKAIETNRYQNGLNKINIGFPSGEIIIKNKTRLRIVIENHKDIKEEYIRAIKNSNVPKLYQLDIKLAEKLVVDSKYIIEDDYDNFLNQEFNKIEKLSEIKKQLTKLDQLEFYNKYKSDIEQIKNYCYNQMTIYEIDTYLNKIEEIINKYNNNLDKFRTEIRENERKYKLFGFESAIFEIENDTNGKEIIDKYSIAS